jgi:hypothetical protein
MENMANLGLFAVHKIFSKYTESNIRIWRIRGKNLCGADEKRLLAYSPNTPRGTNMIISQLIMVQHGKIFKVLTFYTGLAGLSQKKFHPTVPFNTALKEKKMFL